MHSRQLIPTIASQASLVALLKDLEQRNLLHVFESTPLGQVKPLVILSARWIASASMFSKMIFAMFSYLRVLLISRCWIASDSFNRLRNSLFSICLSVIKDV